MLRVEGFKAAMLAPEFGFRVDEVTEIFHLLSRDGFMNYRDYLIEQNQSLRNILIGSIRAASSTLSQNNRSDLGNEPITRNQGSNINQDNSFTDSR